MSDVNIEAIVAAAVAQALAAQASATPAAKTDKSAETAAKAKVIRRNLDPVTVATPDENVTFQVVAASGEGRIFANGARVVPFIDGKVQRSFTGQSLAALVASADDVTKAIATVDKRALLGAHKPATTPTAKTA